MITIPVGKPWITEVETSAVARALNQAHLSQGPNVAAFEREFAQHVGANHAVVCSSGTTGLHLALAAVGFGPGDEVLVPDLTYIATANAVTYTGATPVLVDADRETWCIDLLAAEAAVTPATRAIVPVHLYGRCPDMSQVMNFADRHGLFIIEDAAEALGRWWQRRALGTFGIMGVFSFFGNKVMTTGEGGCVVTNEAPIAQRLRLLRGQGQSLLRRYYHSVIGFNYRMTDLQAALGRAQLSRLDQILLRRRIIFEQYTDRLGAIYECVPVDAAPWLFTILLKSSAEREATERRLLAEGIETRRVFTPMHEQPPYLADATAFPVATELSQIGLSLPTFPTMTDADVDKITSTVLAGERAYS